MVMHAWEGAPGGTSVAAMVAALTEGAPGRTLAATVMLAAPGGAGGARTSQRQETIAVVLAGMMTLTLDDTAYPRCRRHRLPSVSATPPTSSPARPLAGGIGGDTPAALLLVTGEGDADAAPRSGVLAEAARTVDGPPQVWPDERW